VFVCTITYITFKTDTYRFCDIEDSKSLLDFLPTSFFSAPFCGEIVVERRRFNNSITIYGSPKSVEYVSKWAMEYFQYETSIQDSIEQIFQIDDGTHFFCTKYFLDLNNEIVKQESRIEVSQDKKILIILLTYSNKK
jgi:hypothetical protein